MGLTALRTGLVFLPVAVAGLGMAFVTATTTAMAQVDPNRAGMISGVINTAHELGAALARLIHSSWRIVDHHRSLLAAAQRDLPPARIRHLHDQARARVERLIGRGQVEGEFRTDLPRPWLVATFYSVLHGAAEEVDAGRLDHNRVPEILTATLLAAFAAHGGDRARRPSRRREAASGGNGQRS
jgi:hypothetical protein